MKTLAVIIPAYNCPEYILDCYNSVKKQIPVDGVEIDIRIGVDGCTKTSQALKGIKHYFSYNNVGSYIIRNSLLKLSESDFYMYFDSDDTAMPVMVKRCITHLQNPVIPCEIVMPAKIQCNQNMQPIKNAPVIESGGAMCFTHNVLEAVGGFYPARCAADTDFMHRVRMAGFTIYELHEGLYKRRRHNKSLTRSGKTIYGGAYRRNVWQKMTTDRNMGKIKIIPRVTELELR